MSRKLDAIKARQLEEAAKTGFNPYAVRDSSETGATPSIPAAPQSFEHYQASMDADLAQLGTIKDIAEKAVAKKGMIERYWGFVKAFMDAEENYPNSVAVRVMIWLFDVLDIERALDLAFYLINAGNQITPPKFDRDITTFVCDAVYDWAAYLLKEEQSASPYLDAVVAAIDNEKWSLAPPVQSKMYVILAKHKKREGDWANCLALCEKAEAVNPEGAGVKGMKTKAQEKLKALADNTAK